MAAFLNWPGGKRWLAGRIAAFARPLLSGTYYEPFLGGGAVFFALKPEAAVLSDINGDLINVYRCVKRQHRQLISQIQTMPVDVRTYDLIRRRAAKGAIDRAADFLYLNRTAW